MSWRSVASKRETPPRSGDLSEENLMNTHHTRQKPCMTMKLWTKTWDKSRRSRNGEQLLPFGQVEGQGAGPQRGFGGRALVGGRVLCQLLDELFDTHRCFGFGGWLNWREEI